MVLFIIAAGAMGAALSLWIAAVLFLSSRYGLPGLDVDFALTVGESEKHQVEFRWRQTWGDAFFSLDGVEVFHERHPFGWKHIRRYALSVGTSEVHCLTVEKTARRIYAGYRKQRFLVFVDGALVGEY